MLVVPAGRRRCPDATRGRGVDDLNAKNVDYIEPDPTDDRADGLGARGQVQGLASGAKIALLTTIVLFIAVAVLSTLLRGT
jgi:hypothetical protein